MSVKMRKGDERIGRYQLSSLCAKPNAYCGLYLASRARVAIGGGTYV